MLTLFCWNYNKYLQELQQTVANQQKSDNIIKIMEALWSTAGSSRAEIARRIRIDRSTVGAIVETLIKQNIVFEKTTSLPSGISGRPPVIIQLNPVYAYTIGIEITRDVLHIIATGFSGEILYENLLNETGTINNLPQTLISVIKETESKLKQNTKYGLQAVVIGVSGIVNHEKGSILASSDLKITREYVLVQEIQQSLDIPVWLHNDADACALGELLYGDENIKDFLFVHVKKRFQIDIPTINAGLGIVLDGNLREAHSGRGREFRSPLIKPDSQSQFLAAEKMITGELTREEAWMDFADELALSLAFLVHALDIEHIVLGGDAAGEDFQRFSDKISLHVTHNTGIFERVPVLLRKPSAGSKSVAYGASAAAVKLLFQTRQFSIENIGV
jgi:predicted NBD/HSP70 family sugar kinase